MRAERFSAQDGDCARFRNFEPLLQGCWTITVRMRANRRDGGIRLNHEGLEWTLRPQSADDFAEMVGVLASSGNPGHQYLNCGVTDEITVMVSYGEYPEDLRP